MTRGGTGSTTTGRGPVTIAGSTTRGTSGSIGRTGTTGWIGLHGDGRGAEERLAVLQSVEIQADKAVPLALEDQQRFVGVPAGQFADLFAALVDDAELVVLPRLRRQVEIDLDVQILLLARPRW